MLSNEPILRRSPGMEMDGRQPAPVPELPAPGADRLVRQEDAACGYHLFGGSVAQAEANVEPAPVADHLGREAMALVGIACGGGFMPRVWHTEWKLGKWAG